MKIIKFGVWDAIAFIITLVTASIYWFITILVGSAGCLWHILNMDMCIVTKHVAHGFLSIYCRICLFICAVASGLMAVVNPLEYEEELGINKPYMAKRVR